MGSFEGIRDGKAWSNPQKHPFMVENAIQSIGHLTIHPSGREFL